MLADVGLSICPIMAEKGFWFGCEVNAKYVGSLMAWTLFAGNSILFLHQNKNWQIRLQKYFDPATLLSILFFTLTFGLLRMSQLKIESQIGAATSPYGLQISWILMVSGLASTFFLTALLMQFLLSQENKDQKVTEPSRNRSISTTLWQQFLTYFGPLMVVGAYLYFSISVFDAQSEGWNSLEEQKAKLLTFSGALVGWLAGYSLVLFSSQQLLVARLNRAAEALKEIFSDKNPEKAQAISLSNLGSLEPIGQAMNQSLIQLGERRSLIMNFSRFVSDRLIEKVVSESVDQMEGHSVQCAILMTDLRDFTNISSQLKPSEVVDLLNIYFQDMIEVLSKHQVTIDKFIGDGLLAYVPVENGVNAAAACERAVRSSQEMILKLQETNKKLKAKKLPELKIGVGLHFGDVVLGAMGSKTRLQYTIIGDSVNRAARAEGLCKRLNTQLILTDEIFMNLPQEMKAFFGNREEQQIRGIAGRIVIHYSSDGNHYSSAA